MKWEDSKKGFESFLRLEKGLSANSIAAYINDINKLMVFADEELKKTNRKLLSEIEKREKLIEELDAFAHTVAHDLRNSLSSIFSASEIITNIIPSVRRQKSRDGGYFVIFMKEKKVKTAFFCVCHGKRSP